MAVANERFNPDMLRLAREAKELTQSELAEKTGTTQAFISKLEHGLIVQPGEEAMRLIAKALAFPEGFFFQNERAIGFPHFHFRKRAKLGAKPLARINAVINIRRQHIVKLLRSYEEHIEKPIPQIELEDSGLTPEKVAERVRSYWMLPNGPIVDLVGVIENAGGIVVTARFGTNLLDGISFRSEGLPPLFFMNSEVPGDRFRFSLAHELGHMIMHTLPSDDDKMEGEAHRFAASFLMPATDIKPYLVSPKLSTLGRVKSYWKVSIKSLIKRSYDLDIITLSQYRWLNIQYNKSFKVEPCEIPVERASRLQSVISHYRGRLGYSTDDLSKILLARPEDVERVYPGHRPGIRLVVSN